MIGVLPPPAIYDHEYPGQLTLELGTQAEVSRRCIGIGAPGRIPGRQVTIYGCAHRTNGGAACIIVVTRANGWWITDEDQAEIYRHEIAHCNGWPNDHSTPVADR
jgi:hypothetical protein